RRGWASKAPVKTQARIDVPRGGRELSAGGVEVAGVAWAPSRGIDAVELQVDEDAWVEAELAASLSDNTWRQWRMPWNARPGRHTLRVRATDERGVVQPARGSGPYPDGASGYHTVRVQVAAR
ncbi:MAG: hypothetical protein ACRDY4_00670, partial [Acidimicrobiia bacterium]